MNRALQLGAGIVISVVCVLLSLVDVAPRDFLHPGVLAQALHRIPQTIQAIVVALSHARWDGFAAVCVLTIFGFWVRAVRWRYFVQAGRPVPLSSLFSATMIGFMANNVLPFRLGEFVRPWALGRREQLSKSMLLATIVVERAIDMLTLLTIFGVALLLHPIAENTEAGHMVQQGARLMIALSLGLTLFVIAAERNRKVAQLVLAVVPAKLRARAAHLLDRFLDGFALFRDLGRLVQVFALSLGMFLCYAAALGITGASMHIALPWYSGLVMLVVTAIGIMVPAAPGYVGTLNIACVVGLALFGIDQARASAYSWFYFLSQWLPITAVGLYYLHREGLSLKSLGEAHGEAA
ncbi:MAG TPA: lysylphosphatidylglycerol synthase transmembrane domain-containing protein [Candidatus Acidoferrales bacterium]|nr:lysylphosphatidylglycerol synthase transmembrane domain-containing protein [Candidatus Acidoferrales bacterium]